MISALPQSIIEIILGLLPIEEAARTSILSKEWRYKWTKIPKLVFDDYTLVKKSTEEIEYEEISGQTIRRKHLLSPNRSELFDATCDIVYAMRRCQLFYTINQVLLQRQGPILDFTLSAYAENAFFEIDQIISHLSRKHHILRLTLNLEEPHLCDMYVLPLSFFSLHQLTDLYLEWCAIGHVPISNGFGSLTNVTLRSVSTTIKSLQLFLSSCPSLKRLSLFIDEGFESSFFLVEPLKCLPRTIEHLTTSGGLISWARPDSVPQELPTSLINLKYFRFEEMSFFDMAGLTFLAVLIKCSPNLEKIEIEINEESDKLGNYPVILEEYSDVRLEHLIEIDIVDVRDIKLEFELELVKFILARSPNLKNVYLQTYMKDKHEEFETLKVLLRAPRASPAAEIVVHNCYIPR